MRFKNYLDKQEISGAEVSKFVSEWKGKMKSYGCDFQLTKHFVMDRLNDKRNTPSVTVEEMNWLMESYLKQYGKIFKQDVENVKNNIAKPRGTNAKAVTKEYGPNNLEWTVSGSIKDRSNLHMVFVMKQDNNQKGTCVLKPQTVIRTKNKKVTRGEYYEISGQYIMKEK